MIFVESSCKNNKALFVRDKFRWAWSIDQTGEEGVMIMVLIIMVTSEYYSTKMKSFSSVSTMVTTLIEYDSDASNKQTPSVKRSACIR